MDELRIGGLVVERSTAMDHARRYLTEGKRWAYPSYDGFDRAHALGPLVDSDLLAPLLLNVNRISVTTYEALQENLRYLQQLLDRISPDLSLVHAQPPDLALLGELFAVLDGKGIKGAQGTVLSKLLHRKRPRFIPLYDRQVGRVYRGAPGLPPVRRRTWQEYIPLFAAAVQADLRRELPFWQEITALATDPVITPLRALDIVAWSAGRPTSRTTTVRHQPADRKAPAMVL